MNEHEIEFPGLGILDEAKRDLLLLRLQAVHKEPRYDIPEALRRKTHERQYRNHIIPWR